MIITRFLNTYVGLLHDPSGIGGYYATGKTRMEVITKLLLRIYI